MAFNHTLSSSLVRGCALGIKLSFSHLSSLLGYACWPWRTFEFNLWFTLGMLSHCECSFVHSILAVLSEFPSTSAFMSSPVRNRHCVSCKLIHLLCKPSTRMCASFTLSLMFWNQYRCECPIMELASLWPHLYVSRQGIRSPFRAALFLLADRVSQHGTRISLLFLFLICLEGLILSVSLGPPLGCMDRLPIRFCSNHGRNGFLSISALRGLCWGCSLFG